MLCRTPGLWPAPSPTSGPFVACEAEGLLLWAWFHTGCGGGGNLKQDAPGWTGRGSRYLWPVRDSPCCTFTSRHCSVHWSSAFTCGPGGRQEVTYCKARTQPAVRVTKAEFDSSTLWSQFFSVNCLLDPMMCLITVVKCLPAGTHWMLKSCPYKYWQYIHYHKNPGWFDGPQGD